MPPAGYPRLSNAETMGVAAFAFLLAAAVFMLEGRVGFNPADEGYLWYGVKEVVHGAVPIRDFMAYDIGRYYWSGGFAVLGGDDGIVALRASVAIFQALGLAAALLWLARAERHRLALGLGAVILVVWMVPSHKVYDIVLALALVATVAWLVEAPTIRRYFLSGVVLGVVAMFGRNHGVYGAAAMVAAIAWNRLGGGFGPGAWPALAAGIAGVVTGYAPMLALLAIDGGFRNAFFTDLMLMFEAGSTNLPLPVPWPHRALAGSATGFALWREVMTGAMFVAIPVFIAAAVVHVLRRGVAGMRRAPLFIACLLLAVPYAHFAFSRADLSHLAQGIFPVLVGILAWPAARDGATPASVAVSRALLVLVVSLVIVPPFRPGVAARIGAPWPEVAVGADTLRVPPWLANDLAMVRDEVGPHPPGARDVLIAPNWVGMYPALDLRAPVWEIYALFPASERAQMAEIARMEAAGVRVAIVRDVAADGREARRYRNTHPLIQSWLDRSFRVAGNRPRNVTVYRRDPRGETIREARP